MTDEEEKTSQVDFRTWLSKGPDNDFRQVYVGLLPASSRQSVLLQDYMDRTQSVLSTMHMPPPLMTLVTSYLTCSGGCCCVVQIQTEWL